MTSATHVRFSGPRRLGVRRGTTVAALIGLATMALVTASQNALAVHAQDIQLDGNTSPTGISDPSLDWESLFEAGTGGDIRSKSGSLPANFLARGSVADYALPEFSTFATGSKDTLDLTGWQCGKSNNLGAKDDLVNVYTAAYRNPANNHLLLYFGAEKSSNLGDNNIGIWFLQDHDAGCTVPASGKNTNWTGQHVVGDVLLTAAFTNGGTQATVEAHAWTSNGLGSAQSGFLCTPPTATQLANPGSDTSACAITNLSEFNPPWTHPLKTAGAGGALAVQEFYEGGVDVTQLEIDSGNSSADPCISTFVADTRSSQSPTATLFDYAAGSIPVCAPSTTMGTSAMTASADPVAVGQNVTFTVTEKNDGTDPLTAPAGGFVQSSQCSPWDYVSGDANTNSKIDPNETWTFSCTTSFASAGSKTVTVVGHGLDSRLGNRDVTVCPTPDATKICDPDETNSISITVINPSTALSFTGSVPTVRTVHSGEAVTLTFTESNDATGSGNTLSSPSVTANNGCTPAVKTTAGVIDGDTDNDGKLDAGETFTYTCTVHPTADVTVTAIGHGTDALGRDVTYCAEGADTTGKFCDSDERATAAINVINPTTTLSGSGSALVTMTWVETNDALQADEVLTSPSVTANNGCSPAQYVGGDGKNIGDSDKDGKLDSGESWTFTCQITVPAGTSTTVTAVGHGTDATGSEVTFCAAPDATKVCDSDERSSVTVTVS
jgi:hypothetical protein